VEIPPARTTALDWLSGTRRLRVVRRRRPRPRRAGSRVSFGLLKPRTGIVTGSYGHFTSVVRDEGEEAGQLLYLPTYILRPSPLPSPGGRGSAR
jgi:hypothetical protein